MRQAALAKEAGIHIYAIAVGIELNEEIQSIASEPWQENAFNVSSFHDLSALSDQLFDVLNDVCPRMSFTFVYLFTINPMSMKSDSFKHIHHIRK